MLTLFKGELTLNEILYGLPKRRLMEIKKARLERLKQEERDLKKLEQQHERQTARNRILQP